MNREQAKKLLPIIQAFVDGGTVQYKRGGEYDWADIEDPMFYRGDEYRIKPKPLECWAMVDCNNQASFHATKGEAKKMLADRIGLCAPYRVVHLREVVK